MDSLKQSRVLGFAIFAAMNTGCATVTSVHDYCQIAKPIYLQKGEAARLSDSTARAILTHDETYDKVCGGKHG